MLFGQGMTDSLFNAAAGAGQLAPRDHQARPARRASSSATTAATCCPPCSPQGVNVTSDPCSKQLAGGDFQALSLRFFDEQLKHKTTGLTGYRRLHLATPGSKCLTVTSDRPTQVVRHRHGRHADHRRRPPRHQDRPGPIAVAGSPYVTANVTSVGVDTRIFYGLAVGTNAADAKLVQNNVLPLREVDPGHRAGHDVRAAVGRRRGAGRAVAVPARDARSATPSSAWAAARPA